MARGETVDRSSFSFSGASTKPKLLDRGESVWRSCFISHTGRVRGHNEDAYLDFGERGLWAVADGMGGHSKGDMASQRVVAALRALELDGRLSTRLDEAEDAVEQVNQELHLAGRDHGDTIGTTVALLMVVGDQGVCAWVGDSRVYRYRDARLELVTTDHTELEELLALGKIETAAEAAEDSGDILVRAVGGDATVFLDLENLESAPGDTFVLCSDGLNKEVSDAEIAGILAATDEPQQAVHLLLETALERGASDNVTVGVVHRER